VNAIVCDTSVVSRERKDVLKVLDVQSNCHDALPAVESKYRNFWKHSIIITLTGTHYYSLAGGILVI